ncbi:MAG: hypothetical protein ILO36_06490 [Abditibacteriota bacterium]|nr:hypothetical protein [Abditibacteriota bacterium]
MKKKILALGLSCALFISVVCSSLCAGFNLGSLLGGIAVGVLVDTYGSEINSFLNHLLEQNSLDTKSATKVVIIISLGDGKEIGMAQVTGDKAKVDQVKAVLQLESNKTFGTPLRMRGLVPVDKKSVKGVNRVEGVGVSAIIDVRL